MTIHNLAHQGWAHAEKFSLTQLPSVCFHWKLLEFFGEINSLKGGIITADAITTVSPTYAEEILHPDFGNQLEGVLNERKNSLHGILNGVDYSRWNSTSDPYIESFLILMTLQVKLDVKGSYKSSSAYQLNPRPLFFV